MDEILIILQKLEENTNFIQEKYTNLESEIVSLNNQIIELSQKINDKDLIIGQQTQEIENLKKQLTNCSQSTIDLDGGLLGDNFLNIDWQSQNYATYTIENNQLTISGTSRYANIFYNYAELEEHCIPNKINQYNLHLEGYIEQGCTHSCINSTSHPIKDSHFNIDVPLTSSWQRLLKIIIFLNQATSETSTLIITSLNLSLITQ